MVDPMSSQPMPPRRTVAAPSGPGNAVSHISGGRSAATAPGTSADAAVANTANTAGAAYAATAATAATAAVGATADPNAAPGLADLLTGHLGPDAVLLPVTTVTWPSYEHVNVQGALDRWLARNGAPYRLVGLAGFRHR